MSTSTDYFSFRSKGGASRCLDGITIMLVDDSRSVSEAIRIMAIRSGARIRRADSLLSAERHLMIYRPDVVIVDLALPDGSGVELARNIRERTDLAPAVLLISAAEEEVTRKAAQDAGADGYLVKPIQGFSEFQRIILATLPEELRPPVDGIGTVTPDLIGSDAFSHDLENVHDLLKEALADHAIDTLSFAGQFLSGVARTVRDLELAEAAEAIEDAIVAGSHAEAGLKALEIVSMRLEAEWAKAS